MISYAVGTVIEKAMPQITSDKAYLADMYTSPFGNHGWSCKAKHCSQPQREREKFVGQKHEIWVVLLHMKEINRERNKKILSSDIMINNKQLCLRA